MCFKKEMKNISSFYLLLIFYSTTSETSCSMYLFSFNGVKKKPLESPEAALAADMVYANKQETVSRNCRRVGSLPYHFHILFPHVLC